MFMTHLVKEKDVHNALAGIGDLTIVNEISNVIRVEGASSG
jgi:hypothetical protein